MKPGAVAAGGAIPALLLRCEPWLVAVPLSDVRRIADAGAVEQIAGGEGGRAWLGEVAIGGDRLPAWDLGQLLGLTATGGSWVLVDRPLPAALRTGRCLQVTDLPLAGLRPLPRVAGGPPATRLFRTTGGFGLLVELSALLRRAAAAGSAA